MDARLPCPLCGGLIHPIAGRCKHCKGDLRAMRSTRPAAAATLPALNRAGAAHPGAAAAGAAHPGAAPSGYATGHAGVHHAPYPGGEVGRREPAPAQPPNLVQAVAAAGPVAYAAPGVSDTALPILPPRPTHRFPAAAPRASWKSWPVIVIILAVVAIVTAVILMVFPPGGVRDAGTSGPPPPAPDRMDTNPTPSTPRQPPSTSPDPWSRGAAPTTPTPPAAPPAVAPDVDIDDPDLADPTATRDPFSRRGAGSIQPTQMLYSMVKHACTRIAACGAANPQTKQLCDRFAAFPSVTPPRCAAATRCLQNIDEMSCDLAIDDPMKLLQLKDKFTDCSDAMRC